MAAAAAVVVVAGGGTAIYLAQSGSSDSSGTRIDLAAFGVGKKPAHAVIDGDKVTIDAAALPRLTGKRYEVWLTNSARTQMQPVGWIGTDGKARLSVPSDLTDEFDAIEVSVQRVTAPSYDYSGTSVLRGTYRS